MALIESTGGRLTLPYLEVPAVPYKWLCEILEAVRRRVAFPVRVRRPIPVTDGHTGVEPWLFVLDAFAGSPAPGGHF